MFDETCDLTPMLNNIWYNAYVQEQNDNIRKEDRMTIFVCSWGC